MNKIVSLVLLFACSLELCAKEYVVDLVGIVTKEFEINNDFKLNVGDEFKACTFRYGKYKTQQGNDGTHNPNDGSDVFSEEIIESYKEGFMLLIEKDTIHIDKDFGECVRFKVNSINDLWQSIILMKVVPNILVKKGFQYDLRREMELDALEYISTVKKHNLELKDPLLENYIYELIAKVIPNELIDGRNTDVNILIVKDDSRNAAMYPNGTLVLHSGLLSSIKTEDELVAILCHEISHYVLNHSVDNVNSALARKKRAEFWASVATGITAVAELAVAANNSNYNLGVATVTMASLSSIISSMVVDRLGMKYNHNQEREADKYACQALKLLGYDENAMASVLERIRMLDEREQLRSIYRETYTHPKLEERIEMCGKPKMDYNKSFECMMALPIKHTAELKYVNRRYRQAIDIADINIKNNVALPSEYAIKINSALTLSNQNITELLRLVEYAKEIYPKSIILKECEIRIYIRMKDYSKVLLLLDIYEDNLCKLDKSEEIAERLQWIQSVRRRCLLGQDE